MIHISQAANDLLHEVGGYLTEPRGEVIIKGKGVMETFWLLGPSNGNASTQIRPSVKKGLTSNLDNADSLFQSSKETLPI
ncbi:hypothetical protein ANCDUO_05280 [Ancylostoma duodenale]|uniref:Guanylate cyclase domain-containing protein n=1 Tax=Ancylostoma duodenale TaxID=51022 RepID=A0A0C2GZ20_9BILA|nr:hypothetical protein ANCDUO_05280 [Ancylostoma duodenale]